MAKLHKIEPEHAERMWGWLHERGGIALWKSINLSNASKTWSTPALTDGKPTPKPSAEAEVEPARIITDPAEVHVFTAREVKRLHVALRMGAQGFMVKITDGSKRRIDAAVARAEEKYQAAAWYEFDHWMQEAVIFVETGSVPLAEWLALPRLPETETIAV